MITSPYFQRHLFFSVLFSKAFINDVLLRYLQKCLFLNFRFVSKTFGNDISL
jgi:hypothetical protein